MNQTFRVSSISDFYFLSQLSQFLQLEPSAWAREKGILIENFTKIENKKNPGNVQNKIKIGEGEVEKFQFLSDLTGTIRYVLM
jgi:hypothetical protein